MSKRSSAEWARLAALFTALAALVALARPTAALVAVGGVLALAGEALRLWAAGHLLKTEELVTGGPYRYTRHPLYLGRLVIFTGLALACRLPGLANLAVLVAGWAVFFAYYLPRKERIEPARLAVVHGAAYATYHAAVPRFWPRLVPWPGGRGRWSLTRALSNREPLTALALALIFAALAVKAARG